MAVVSRFVFSQSDLEDYLDQVKILIAGALVTSGLVDSDAAEEWCKNHTVIIREVASKHPFRSIFSRWTKKKSEGGHYIIVVKAIGQPQMEEVQSIEAEIPVEEPTEG